MKKPPKQNIYDVSLGGKAISRLSHIIMRGSNFNYAVRYSTVSDTFMKDSGIISVQSQHGLTLCCN